MRTRIKFAAVTLIGLLPAMVAFTGPTSGLKLEPRSRLWIDGTSTVRSFRCKANTMEAQVEATGPGAIQAVMAGERAVRSVALTVQTAQLDCGNGTMNGHMMKALKASEHPTIEFALTSYETARADAGVKGKVTGQLTLGGVTKTITMEGGARDAGDGALLVSGTHTLKMTEFGLKPPTLMMGTMKVNENVSVGFELYLKD
ncbi:MAG TPA: YceI family protein [Gemmatimonadaceae bacterium]|nr:YceI family protein [Gemmatimonadaceae bacterium]